MQWPCMKVYATKCKNIHSTLCMFNFISTKYDNQIVIDIHTKSTTIPTLCMSNSFHILSIPGSMYTINCNRWYMVFHSFLHLLLPLNTQTYQRKKEQKKEGIKIDKERTLLFSWSIMSDKSRSDTSQVWFTHSRYNFLHQSVLHKDRWGRLQSQVTTNLM